MILLCDMKECPGTLNSISAIYMKDSNDRST